MSAERGTGAFLDEPISIRRPAMVVHVAAGRSWSIVGGASDRHRACALEGITATSWSGTSHCQAEAVGAAENTRSTVESGPGRPGDRLGTGSGGWSGQIFGPRATPVGVRVPVSASLFQPIRASARGPSRIRVEQAFLLPPLRRSSCSGPARSRSGRSTDDVHAGGRVALEGGIRLFRVVDDAGHDDRRRAVLEQVGALGEPPRSVVVLEEVVDRPRHAVALRLAGHDDGVEGEQLLDRARCSCRPRRSPSGPSVTSGPSIE